VSAWEEVHRGYGISYQNGDKIVRVRRPGASEPIDAAAYAEAGEKRQDLRKKARALIAADMTQLR